MSGRKYKDCHMIRGLSTPGAATPPDTDEVVYISPNTSLRLDGVTVPQAPVPITMQGPVPQAVPVTVDEAVVALAAVQWSNPPLSHEDIASLRYALLDTHGIADPDSVLAGVHDAVLESVLPELADNSLQLARATIDRIMVDQELSPPPVMLHADRGNISRLVGQTMFWADHYLMPDQLAATAARAAGDPSRYRKPLAEMLSLRPLVEAGIVVPVYADLAVALATSRVDAAVSADLHNEDYVAWVRNQIVIEGPTAREAAFIHVVDDYRANGWVYLLNRIQSGSAQATVDGTVQWAGRMLGHFDPDDDYGPWLGTLRQQATAQMTKVLNIDLAVASGLGADLVTRSPFRARALRRRHQPPGHMDPYDPTVAVWADVPWLPDAPPDLLVKIARNESRVEDLRRATATALRTIEADDLAEGSQAIADLAGDLSAAGARLGRELRGQAAVNLALSSGLAGGSVLIGATLAPLVAAGGALAALAAAVPAVRDRAVARKKAAYAFWMAHPKSRRKN